VSESREEDHKRALTREEWIALQVELAPEITPEVWRRTVRLLRASQRRKDAD
jgi:hypothetical protein